MKDETGGPIKALEKASELILEPGKPIVARLDGNSFSKLTRGLRKPFDDDFIVAMNEATEAVLQYAKNGGCVLAYVQSDEISLLFKPQNDAFLANRTQKLASLLASTASVAFNAAMPSMAGAVFDCRVFTTDDPYEVFAWRQRDCYVNCASVIHHWMNGGRKRGHSAGHGLDTLQKIEEIAVQKYHYEDPSAMCCTKQQYYDNYTPKHLLFGRTFRREVFEVPLREILGESKIREIEHKGVELDLDSLVTRSRWDWNAVKITQELINEVLA